MTLSGRLSYGMIDPGGFGHRKSPGSNVLGSGGSDMGPGLEIGAHPGSPLAAMTQAVEMRNCLREVAMVSVRKSPSNTIEIGFVVVSRAFTEVNT